MFRKYFSLLETGLLLFHGEDKVLVLSLYIKKSVSY